MSTPGSIPLPPLTSRPGADAFNTIVALVRNRTGSGYTDTFNQVLRSNADLMRPPVLQHGVENLGRVLNRSQAATGLPIAEDLDRVVNKVSRIVGQFAPDFANYPTALQWDVLWRTALQLDRAGIPERLFNRRVNDPEVSSADWKKANGCADAVFALLNSEDNDPMDRGTLAQFQSKGVNPSHVRAVFRSAIQSLTADGSLTMREAFDQLKEDEPIFWTLAMLSFEPEK